MAARVDEPAGSLATALKMALIAPALGPGSRRTPGRGDPEGCARRPQGRAGAGDRRGVGEASWVAHSRCRAARQVPAAFSPSPLRTWPDSAASGESAAPFGSQEGRGPQARSARSVARAWRPTRYRRRRRWRRSRLRRDDLRLGHGSSPHVRRRRSMRGPARDRRGSLTRPPKAHQPTWRRRACLPRPARAPVAMAMWKLCSTAVWAGPELFGRRYNLAIVLNRQQEPCDALPHIQRLVVAEEPSIT